MTDGLLLIHAFPLDARMWAPQIEGLGGERTIAPDLPGFGGSDPPASDVTTMADSARRCLQALDAAGLERAVVCGLSMGGYVAFELWRRARDRIAGLVLANTKAEADTPQAADGRRALADRLRNEGNVLIASPPPLLSAAASTALWDQVKSIVAAQPADWIAAAALGMAVRPDSTSDLPGIDVPTLVITAEGDTLIPPDVTSPMADKIPGAKLAVIETAGHLSNLEQPEEFTRLVREHVGRCGVDLTADL
jgi:3-oxoadipate enol-lactonase